MSFEILNFTASLQTALSAIVSAFALIKFSSRSLYIKLIGLAFLLSFTANACAFLLFWLGLKSLMNVPQTFYDSIIICVISLIFYNALGKRFGKMFLIVTAFYLLFALVNFLFLQKHAINSYNKFLSSFIVISYCIMFFYRLMVELPSTHLQRMPMFWFNSALLIYYAGALILFVFTSYIINVLKQNLITYWIFHNSLSICEHFLVLIGLYCDLFEGKKNRHKVNFF